jgi:hypothetical protein
MVEHLLAERSLEQLVNTATFPGVEEPVLAMPDIHQGYWMSRDAPKPPLNACGRRCGSHLTTPMPCSISRCYYNEQTNMPRRQITGGAISPAIGNLNGQHGRADH